MSRFLLSLLILVGICCAQETAPAAEMTLVRVTTLASKEANQEFQRNVRIMQARREKLVALKSSGADDETFQKELDALNRDNAAMFQTYGYSLLRNYTLEIEKSHIYVLASNEEAAQLAAEETRDAGDKQKLVRVATLNSVEANNEFRRNVRIMQAQRDAVLALQQEVEAGEAEQEPALNEALKKLSAENKQMAEAYGYTVFRDYTIEIERASVYMLVTAEEAAKIEATDQESK